MTDPNLPAVSEAELRLANERLLGGVIRVPAGCRYRLDTTTGEEVIERAPAGSAPIPPLVDRGPRSIDLRTR